MKSLFRSLFKIIPVAILALAAAGCGSDQDADRFSEPSSPSTPPGQREQAPDWTGDAESPEPIGDMELERAAAAYLEIQDIERQLQQSFQQTEDPNERQRLQAEANKWLVHAVENAGLGFETYNYIMNRVGAEEKLNERFREKLQGLR